MRALLIGLLCLCFALAPATARAELRVAVTIKPIHALTAGVLGKIATPYLIVKGAATPHSYALKPSDATALQKADVVIRIGGTMERFLDSAIKTISPDATVISLIDIDGITRLPFRQGVAWGTGDDHDHDHGHNHSQRPEPHTTTPQNASDSASHQAALPVDPHIWLAPDNAIRMVATIVSALSRAAPDHAAVFASNGAILTDRLRALAAEIATKTAPVGDRRFLVFHDAFQYYENAFGVQAAGAISLAEGRSPGAQRIRALRQRIKQQNIACIFSEPQFEPKILRAIIEQSGPRQGTLDPIGADIVQGPDAYFKLMRRNTAALVACLKG